MRVVDHQHHQRSSGKYRFANPANVWFVPCYVTHWTKCTSFAVSSTLKVDHLPISELLITESSMSQWSTNTTSATNDGIWQRRIAALPRITWSSLMYGEYVCQTTGCASFAIYIRAVFLMPPWNSTRFVITVTWLSIVTHFKTSVF